MSDTNFASLGPTLLARKGGAKPAMRPQHGTVPAPGEAAQNLEDLGWNDMGSEDEPHKAPVLPLTPASAGDEAAEEAREQDDVTDAALEEVAAEKPEVVLQQEAIAERIETPVEVPAQVAAPAKKRAASRKRKSALARGKRAAFTLRLDAERHLKLRLACTVRNRSAQQLVTDALDQLLGEMTDIDQLAAQVRGSE